MPSDVIVQARIDSETKARALDALDAMGLSISDAIRLLMYRIAEERRLPFDTRRPNAETVEAMAEVDAGGGTRVPDVGTLFRELGI